MEGLPARAALLVFTAGGGGRRAIADAGQVGRWPRPANYESSMRRRMPALDQLPHSNLRRRDLLHSLEHEFLDALSVLHLGDVEVALLVHIHMVHDVEL